MAGFYRPALLFTALLALPTIYLALREAEIYGKAVTATHAVIILLVAGAAAGPFYTAERSVFSEPRVTVLSDSSESMSVLEEASLDLGEVEVRERTVASGNSSELRSGLLDNLEPNRAYIAISDFRSTGGSLEDVARKYRSRNSTVYAIRTDQQVEEASVSIEGPETTVPGGETGYEVVVRSPGDPQAPNVTLDGEQVELESAGEGSWSFERTFESEGQHVIKAEIDVDDRYDVNDRFYRTVEVVEKPEVLVVGDPGSSLESRLSEFYSLEERSQVPENLSDYYATILARLPENRSLAEYVVEGNGVVYTGEVEEEGMPGWMPVRYGQQEDTGLSLMIAVDASLGTGGECTEYLGDSKICLERSAEGGSIKKTKRIAAALLDGEGLPPNAQVGAVYYNDQSYLISKPRTLSKSNHREKLKGGILNIPVEGPSEHDRGISGAQEALNGSGNILLVSDGKIGGYEEFYNVSRDSRELARNSDAKIITIGVGGDTNTGFLQQVASLSGGYHVPFSSALEFSFAGGGAPGQGSSLIANDRTHYITEGLDLSTTVSRLEDAETRRGARRLVSAGSRPFLSVWRYGLGRVAAYAGDGTGLENTVAGDPLLVTRTVAWAVGDPKRKRDRWLRVEDQRMPDSVEARASYSAPGFERDGENYARELEPPQGVNEVNGTLYAYNYPEELEKLGYSDSMEDFVSTTGGEVYAPDEAGELAESIKRFSDKEVDRRQSLAPHLLLAALLLFLAEVGYRKVKGRK